MSGMLNNQLLPPDLIASLLAASQDPMQKPMPGESLMGPGAMPNQPPMGMGAMAGMQSMAPNEQQQQGGPPGLPQFPPNMGGFGLGRFAPETNQGNPLRQQLIQQLMQMLPNLGRGIGGIE